MPEEPSDDERAPHAERNPHAERDERAAHAGGAGAGEEVTEPTTALPPKLERWRRRSAAGAIMTGFALGLQQVFEPEQREPSIMLETSGDPPGDLPVDADLDGITARDSIVRIRPWLLHPTGGAGEPSPSETAGHSPGGTDEVDRP